MNDGEFDRAEFDGAEFDRALIGAAFALAGEKGWAAVTVPEAARRAELSLAKARERFPNRTLVLLKFGRIADQAALADPPKEGSVRDRLFYLLMQRIDVFQAHREGVLALLRALPSQPDTGLVLACATRRSMAWLLEAAGVSSRGMRGMVRVKGLVAIWLWTVRAWQSDETADLSGTMSALDSALRRAERFAGWMGGGIAAAEPTSEPAEAGGDEILAGEPPAPESPPPPMPPSVPPPPPMPPTSLPPEPLA